MSARESGKKRANDTDRYRKRDRRKGSERVSKIEREETEKEIVGDITDDGSNEKFSEGKQNKSKI